MRLWSFLLLAPALAAQTGEVTTTEQTPLFQSSVTLVRVPVVVRDRQGHTVGTLHKEDFQLADRGKPQYISQFAVEGAAPPAGESRPVPPEPLAPAGNTEASPARAAPTRFVSFVFDDAHLKREDLMGARNAALKHVEHGIPPQERIALLTLSGRLSLEFTGDAARFRDALMKVEPVPPRVHFPPASFYMADLWMNRDNGDRNSQILKAQIAVTADCLHLLPDSAGAADIAQSTLRAVANEGRGDALYAFRVLNNTVRLMAAAAGDRVMILVSPGMYLPIELQKELGESIDRATRLGVVINTLDARGVFSLDPSAEVPGCRLTTPETQLQIARYQRDEITSQGIILGDLAYGTGGAALARNDLGAEFTRLAGPPEFVYYLGFYPTNLKADEKYHEIKVTLAAAKGFSLQARKGYWAPSHEEDAAAASAREIAEAVFSHEELRDLPLDIHTEFFKASAGNTSLTVTAHLDIRHLPLRKQDDRSRDDITLVCALFDSNGNYLKATQKTVELRLKDESLERRLARGVTVASDFDVQSGPYVIRIVVRDSQGRQMGASNSSVEIP